MLLSCEGYKNVIVWLLYSYFVVMLGLGRLLLLLCMRVRRPSRPPAVRVAAAAGGRARFHSLPVEVAGLFLCFLSAAFASCATILRLPFGSPLCPETAREGEGGAALERAAGREGTAGAAPADGDDVHDELNLADVSLFKLPDVLMKPLA
eukprot:GHVT01050093.1.p1 GENE.GHVT01050093.1~~GHVT01050093.1.p1  ORF type:complete len:150 (+),score=22.20 GHVT01050093.1:444-893(+)